MQALFDGFAAPAASAQIHRRHAAGFDLLTVLYRHGVLAQETPTEALELAMAGTMRPTLPTLSRDFERGDTAGLLAAAGKLLGKPARLRGKPVRLRGENVFTQHFVPPAAKRVPECLDGLWWSLRRAVETSASGAAEQRCLIAYAAFFALLTVHPFADGNGRTARMLFAALLHAGGVDCPVLALALPLSFAEGGRRFHQAALLARSGHFGELRAMTLDAVREANARFAPDVERLIHALDSDDRLAAKAVFRKIHSDLHWAMLPVGV
ncbi:MAG: Fic family protein [Xanthomonadaceae bacterium]|nr:Fic family protein [Xanthomonadaceae bacterium]